MSPNKQMTAHGAAGLSEIDLEREHYDEEYSNSDLAKPIPNYLARPRKSLFARNKLLWDRYVGNLAGKRVLECGCGDGGHAVWLASQGAQVVGVDLSPVGAEKTVQRAKLHGLGDRVTAYGVDCSNLESVLRPESIDVALGWAILHHMPPKEFGESLARILKPGGCALFFENSSANPLFTVGRHIRNSESVCGSPLTSLEADTFIAAVGCGQRVYPHFGLFHLTKKYVLRNSALYGAIVDSVDAVVDVVPGSRRYSAHMWVYARKSA